MIVYYERYVVIQPGQATNEEGEPAKNGLPDRGGVLNILENSQ